MFFNILFSVIIWGVIALAILKFLPVLGINPNNKIPLVRERQGEKADKQIMIKIFVAALIFRMVVYLIGSVAGILVQKPSEYTLNTFLSYWNRWDAPRYISIAKDGYGGMTEQGEPLNCVFFPLYPWVVRIVSLVVRNTQIAAMLVSTFAYSAAMPFMYAFICRDYNKKIALLSILYLSSAPFTFFMGGVMTESIFLLTLVLTWYFVKERKWITAAVFGLLCAMSRSVGVLAAIPYVMELIESNAQYFKDKQYKKFFAGCIRQGIWVLLIPLGIVIYLLINYYYTGDFLKFMEYQQKFWLHTSCYFGKGIQNMWNDSLSGGRNLVSKLELFWPQTFSYTIAALIMLLLSHRHKSSYTLYFAAYFIFNTAITWSMSGARYEALALPLYVMLAEATEKKKYASTLIIISSAMLQGIYLTMYLSGRQIM